MHTSESQSYPFSLTGIKKYVEEWAERFPVIDQVTLCHGKGVGASYALVVHVDKALHNAFSEWWKAKGNSDIPDKLLPMKDFLNWQAGGESCAHIEEELASVQLIPQKNLGISDDWLWLVQPAGANLPSDLVAPGGEVLYSRHLTVDPSGGEAVSYALNIYRRVGEKAWIVRYEGKEVGVSKSEGHEIIRLLLENPKIPRDGVELWKRLGKEMVGFEGSHSPGREKTINRIRRQIRDAKNSLEAAKDTGNKMQENESEELIRQLQKQVHGAKRRTGGSNKKIERNIKGSFNRALDELENCHEKAGQYLRQHIIPTAQGYVYSGEVKWKTE